MLTAILDKEKYEELSETEQQHYAEREGKFHLDVEAVNGVALENVTALKTTVGKLRANEKKLQTDLTTIQERYEDIDPDEAKEAIKKYDEVKNWDGDKKVQEAVDASKRELVKAHKKQVETLTSELADSQEQLTDAIVDTKVVEALQKEEGNVELLLPHVKKHVRMTKNSTGKWIPEVVNDANEPRVGDSDGNPMTILQYIQELKTQKTFAPCFPGANSTGSGGNETSDSGKKKTTKKTGKVKTINASDGKAMSQNVDDIASGEVKVDTDK